MNYIAVLFKPPKGFRDFGACYSPEWANKLYRNLHKWSPNSTLTIITDFEDGFIPEIRTESFIFKDSGWAKMMEMYRPELVGDRSILIGLDNIFIGDLSEIESCDHEIIVPRAPFRPQYLCNALVSLTGKYSKELWEYWLDKRESDLHDYKYQLDGQWSEMLWLRDYIKKPIYWDDLLPNQIVSYKKNGDPNKNNRFIYFHGNPKQHNLSGKDWVSENWI